jgi:hypothetical protein
MGLRAIVEEDGMVNIFDGETLVNRWAMGSATAKLFALREGGDYRE